MDRGESNLFTLDCQNPSSSFTLAMNRLLNQYREQPMMEKRAQVQRVLIVVMGLNFAVAIAKLLIGAVTGAVSITADGFHSLMDGASNVIGLVGNRIASKPADENHPYGHGRFETVAALGIGILLFITAWEIVTSALERFASGETPQVDILTFVVMLGTLVVNLFTSRYERHQGETLQSEVLIADAANTSADVYVTLSVLVSLVLVSLGWTWADPVAALIVVVMIVRAGWKVLHQTGSVLVDTAPFEPQVIEAIARSVPSVDSVFRARSRGTTDDAFIDIEVQVSPYNTTAQNAVVAQEVRDVLFNQLEGVSEVAVKFLPNEDVEQNYAQIARSHGDALGLSTHEVQVFKDDEGEWMELHVEVARGLTLERAHQQVSDLERRIKAEVPQIKKIVTHIEPEMQIVSPHVASVINPTDLQKEVMDFLQARFPQARWHDLHTTVFDEGCNLSIHAALPAQISIEEAHTLAEDAETQLRTQFSQFTRITIHAEPF